MRSATAALVVGVAGCSAVIALPEHVGFGPLLDAGAPDASAGDSGADAAPPPGPRCSGLAKTCGADHEDCCTPIDVPGGSFIRGNDAAADNAYKNSVSEAGATVHAFSLDKFEVTVGRFRGFLAAYREHLPAEQAGKSRYVEGDQGWSTAWTAFVTDDVFERTRACMGAPSTEVNENRAVDCVTWFEAYAFCIWDGGRLPTEAEWDYAAAGGIEQRAYPWSDPPGSLKVDDQHAESSRAAFTGTSDQVGLHPAGAGRWGHMDLAGNVAEWVLDAATDVQGYVMPCVDCVNLTGPKRAIKGGSSVGGAELWRTGRQGATLPTDQSDILGVRCAREGPN
jgi:formylglycine-generating enzyme required for sulfatase activity